MLYSFYFEYISIINDMILNFMMLATVKHFFGGGEGGGLTSNWKKDLRSTAPPPLSLSHLNGQLCLEK